MAGKAGEDRPAVRRRRRRRRQRAHGGREARREARPARRHREHAGPRRHQRRARGDRARRRTATRSAWSPTAPRSASPPSISCRSIRSRSSRWSRRSARSIWCSRSTRSRKYKTLADFIKAAKAQPGKLNIGTIAVGGTQNLGAELFKSLGRASTSLIVPYQELARHRRGAAAQRRADDGRVPAGDPGPGQRRQAARARELGPEARAAHAGRADGRRKPASKATR